MAQDIIKNIPLALDINARKRLDGTVDIRLYSKDIATGQFEFTFIDEDGDPVALDETYSAQALVRYNDEEKTYLNDMTIDRNIIRFIFPHDFITKDGTITMYIYVTKDNYTSDVAAISFPVFVSEIDKDLDPSVSVHYIGKIEQLIQDMKDEISSYQVDVDEIVAGYEESVSKLQALETDYEPQLTSLTAQLAQKADKSQIGAPSQEQVSAWLAANPQATTTVQDSAVTLTKLNEDVGIFEQEHHNLILGNVSNVTGAFDNSSSRLATSDFVPVFIGEELVFKGQPSPDKNIRIVYYHPDKSFKSGVNVYAQQTTDRIFPITENGFVKYVIWKGTTALTATEIAELPTFVYLKRNKLRKNMLTFENVYQENTIPLPLQAGGIDKESGIITSAENATVSDDFTTMKRTGKYLRVIGGTKAKLEYPNGVGYVFEFDRNFTYLGNAPAPSGSSLLLRKNTALIKTAFEGVTVARMEPKLTYTYNGPHEWVYNDNKFNRATYKYVNFIYEVDTNQGQDILASDSTETQYSLDRHFNSALLRLPKNYDPFGKPTKLIIFVQGSGSYPKFDTASPHQNYEYTYSNIFDYIIDEGYAILGVYPWTTKYNIITNTSTNQVTPTAVAAYTQAYKWVTDNFNISDNGVFVSGKSSGGFMGTALGYNRSIPVLATGLLAPVISPLKEVFGPTYDTRLAYAQDFGFEGDHTLLDGNPTVVRTPELNEYIRLNAPKTVGYNPYWQGLIGEDLSQLIEAGIDGSEFDWELNKNKQRISSSPIKIWCSEDDPILTYRQARLYIKSIQNAQGNAELRTMPNGTGGHASVDRDENALKVPNITTRLGVQYTNVATAVVEMIQYFRRFEN